MPRLSRRIPADWTSAIAALEEAPPERAREFVARAVRNWRFRAHLSGRGKADFPIAVLGREQAEAIGARSRIVWLSGKTAIDKARPEPDGHGLVARNYLIVQDMLDCGMSIQIRKKSRSGRERHLGTSWAPEDGKPWFAVVKATDKDNGAKVYLQSLRRTGRDDISRLRKKAAK